MKESIISTTTEATIITVIFCQNWKSKQRQNFPAVGKRCNHYEMENLFAKVCRKRFNDLQKNANNRQVNNVKADIETENTVNNVANYIEMNTSNYLLSDDNYVAIISDKASKRKAPMDLKWIIATTDCLLTVNLGSACSIINSKLAKQFMYNCILAEWSEKKRLLSNELFQIKCSTRSNAYKLRSDIMIGLSKKCCSSRWSTSNSWYRLFSDKIGIRITQQPLTKKKVNFVNNQ